MVIGDYKIDIILETDALGICNLMVTNAERFKRFFPKTLEQNLTLELSQVFTVKKIKECTAKEEFLYTIKERETSQVIGLIYIKELDWKKKQGEFAYCIDANYEGKGLTSKIVKELSRHAFINLGLETLQIIAHKTNLGSIKVAEKCDYIWQRTLFKVFTPPNESPLDMELYELYNPVI